MSLYWRKLGFLAIIPLVATTTIVAADELLYRYEFDVVPWDPSAGWKIAQACEGVCAPTVDNGHFVMDWVSGSFANNH